MELFEITSLLVVLAGLFSYLNYQYLRLPTTIGVMLIALLSSLLLIALGNSSEHFSFLAPLREHARHVMTDINFGDTLLHGMLAFLLFAGSLHLDLHDLAKEWIPISFLALVGTLLSTAAVGGGLYYALSAIHITIPVIPCLLFGALISPTDPVAVLGIMKAAGAPKPLETQVAGESLFNDGVGVVLFLALLQIFHDGHAPTLVHSLLLLVQEVGGGALLGIATGYATFAMLRRVDNYQVEVLLTLALAMGVYSLAEAIHVSAPIAVVAAGLLIGNQGRRLAMSKKTEEHLDAFWELIDEILNVLLFMLMGLELLVLPFRREFFVAGLVAIVVSLLARGLSVAAVLEAAGGKRRFRRGSLLILTWGGLRGGISIAMALSLPNTLPQRDLLLAATYAVVVFSVLLQGLTIGKVVRLYFPNTAPAPTPSH